MDEIVEAIGEVVSSECSGGEIHLVGHDWGSFFCQRYAHKYPEKISKLVLLDVGSLGEEGTPAWMSILTLAYMAIFALSFVVSRLVSNWLAIFLLRCYPWKMIGPLPYETEMPSVKTFCVPREIFMTYPYFRLFYDGMRNPTLLQPLPFAIKGSNHSENDNGTTKAPGIPQLFLFGAKKRVFYHSNAYLDFLDQQGTVDDCSGYVEFKKDGHWLHWTNPDGVAAEMKKFLGSK